MEVRRAISFNPDGSDSSDLLFSQKGKQEKKLKLSLGELEPVGRHRSPWHSHVPEQIVWYVHPIQTLQPLGVSVKLWSQSPKLFWLGFCSCCQNSPLGTALNCPRRRWTLALTFKDFNFSILKVQNNLWWIPNLNRRTTVAGINSWNVAHTDSKQYLNKWKKQLRLDEH